ncbi:pyridoxal phosphate-dependent decarboxylase family protein [Prauserella muralis]|uniref:Amino acid decarboxylase n=1 Tax=Prauserella muralis TaxID=588067 RepID=A0A2V4B0P8_9PSEU|nr:aminotransferase class V-fold PLP-dependent enzyme [Prauserella muralis]PXY26948.1 amino acid decarboxylase [Prauserella muralis]TWE23439.1 aromatic-L-amino-acid decarboxylase [Prauserella muralis]
MQPALDPTRDEIAAMMNAASSFVSDFLEGLPTAPAAGLGDGQALVPDLLGPPGEEPGDFGSLLSTVREAASYAVETAGPGYLAYFPAGGLFASALADLLAATVNRYTGVSSLAPALVAMEHGVIRWLCDEFGLPSGSGGVVTTGASTATLSALGAARQQVLGGPSPAGTVYVTEHTHHCVAKAARIAGLTADQVREVPVTAELRMDPDAAREAIRRDRAAGRRPFLLVGTGGTTSTGTVDPLPELGELARQEGLWFHVDAAYGGGFQLTGRGRAILSGIEAADSVTLDPHKSLFLPYGTGVLLVRDQNALRAAHVADADYLQDLHHDGVLPDFADLGVELTRDFRGLRLWLPLRLHGAGAFRAALDEKLDLAAFAHRELREFADLPVPPDLTVLVFRVPGGDGANRRLLEAANASKRIFLSSTVLDGRYTPRLCILSHRTHRPHVEEALDILRSAA